MDTKQNQQTADSDNQVDAPQFKARKGAEVKYFGVRSGGQVFDRDAAIVREPAKGDPIEAVDLSYTRSPDGKAGNFIAIEIRRGRGPIDAPCWTPRA